MFAKLTVFLVFLSYFSDLTPEKVLENSLRAHLQGETRLEIQDFHLKFLLKARSEQGKITLQAEHMFKKPDLVKSLIDDQETNTKVYSGFDGKEYWVFNNGKKTILLGKDYAKDIQEIEQNIRLSKIFEKTFTIDRFRLDLENPQIVSQTDEEVALQALGRDFPFLNTPGFPSAELTLYFAKDSWLLKKIIAIPIDPASGERLVAQQEKLELQDHKVTSGIMIPEKITIWVGLEEQRPALEIIIGKILINPGYEEKDFLAPA